MSLLDQMKDELEEVLDEHFPKVDENGQEKNKMRRGAALVLFSEAVLRFDKLIKAFGGCEFCYGKGYSTNLDFSPSVVPCKCDRGRQFHEIMVDWSKN